jgi:hypothetical protein
MEELIPHLATLKNADGTSAFDASKDPVFQAVLEKFKIAQTAQTELANLRQTQEADAAKKSEKEKDAEVKKEEIENKKIAHQTDNTEVANKFLTEAALESYLAKSFNTHVPKLLEKQLKPLFDSVTELKSEGVAQYKARLLKENTDNIIPEMLKGTTKAELDAALVEAKAVHLKYFKKEDSKAPANTPNTTTNTNNNQKVPVVPIGGNGSQTNAPLDIKSMDAKTYAEKRAELLAKARSGQLT